MLTPYSSASGAGISRNSMSTEKFAQLSATRRPFWPALPITYMRTCTVRPRHSGGILIWSLLDAEHRYPLVSENWLKLYADGVVYSGPSGPPTRPTNSCPIASFAPLGVNGFRNTFVQSARICTWVAYFGMVTDQSCCGHRSKSGFWMFPASSQVSPSDMVPPRCTRKIRCDLGFADWRTSWTIPAVTVPVEAGRSIRASATADMPTGGSVAVEDTPSMTRK